MSEDDGRPEVDQDSERDDPNGIVVLNIEAIIIILSDQSRYVQVKDAKSIDNYPEDTG